MDPTPSSTVRSRRRAQRVVRGSEPSAAHSLVGAQPGTVLERDRSDVALLAFVAWVCSVPFVLLVSMPYVGWQSGALLALLWLGVVATACFALCARRLSGRGEHLEAPEASPASRRPRSASPRIVP